MPTDKQRRENERRRLQRQLQRRQEREIARRRVTMIVSVVATLALVGVVVGIIVATTGNGGTPAANASSPPPEHHTTSPATHPSTHAPTSPVTSPSTAVSSSTKPLPAGTCVWNKSGTAAKKVSLPPTHVPHTGTTTVQLQTTQGPMTFTLNQAHAPCAVASFVSLAEQKYFDNTPCHRLTTAASGISVLQCGDPTGTGRGGPGYEFADELTGNEKYTKGVLAMANSGANTNGSQFFINYGNSTLSPNYTVFGTVSKGLSTVEKVAAKGVKGGGSDGSPALPISITKVTVEKKK